jgi:hypothetical protein
MTQPDDRLSLHWRSTSFRQEMTDQEEMLAKWLDNHGIAFHYEQLQLIKNNNLAGQHVVEGQKVRKRDVQRSVPDFVFTQEGETFFIELTDRRRPDGRRPHSRQYDPKKRMRHLARLAGLDYAVIYRDELDGFFDLYQKISAEKNTTSALSSLEILHTTVNRWSEIEWSNDLLAASALK